jgi:pSer/pThr/pTyr-binding forkhead associated (FHA) protein
LPAQGPVPHQRTRQKFEGQKTRPTHILYRNLAYPITEKPLIVGQSDDDDESGLQIKEQTDRVLRKHCTVRLQDNEVILNDYGTSGTFVDDTPVNVKTILSLGQTVRIGTPGETLKLIACQNRETDET